MALGDLEEHNKAINDVTSCRIALPSHTSPLNVPKPNGGAIFEESSIYHDFFLTKIISLTWLYHKRDKKKCSTNLSTNAAETIP